MDMFYPFRVPSIGKAERDIWIETIESHQDFQHFSQILICENHFNKSVLVQKKGKNTLAQGAKPSIFPAKPLDENDEVTLNHQPDLNNADAGIANRVETTNTNTNE